jgi:hypothetical protein
MAFDRDGVAGTAVALEDALTEIAEGESQRVIDADRGIAVIGGKFDCGSRTT